MARDERITLSDDGTMDTVLVCECGAEFRYTYAPTRPDMDDDDHRTDTECYDDFVQWAVEDAEAEHVCPTPVQCRGCGAQGQVIQDEGPVLMWACPSCSLVQHVAGSEMAR